MSKYQIHSIYFETLPNIRILGLDDNDNNCYSVWGTEEEPEAFKQSIITYLSYYGVSNNVKISKDVKKLFNRFCIDINEYQEKINQR